MSIPIEIRSFNQSQSKDDREICDTLASLIEEHLPEAESKIWHKHPVWFLEGNPVVGYSRQKAGIRLMFWSGRSFAEDKLLPGTGKFKDASIFYNLSKNIDAEELQRWLQKGRDIQWDYRNIVKRKGVLVRLK